MIVNFCFLIANVILLADDNFSAENGIIVVRATRWPLAVDPQGQALIWITKLEEKNDINVRLVYQPVDVHC